MRRRWVSLSLVALFALPWSVALGAAGLWLLDTANRGTLGDPWISMSAGIAALCAAQLVLLLCVAGRVFPAAHHTLTTTIESLLAATFLLSSGVLVIAALTRGVLS